MSVKVVRVWSLLLCLSVSFAFASYAVQLGAFKTKAQVQQQQKLLSDKGIDTITKYTKHWYKIFYGPFAKKSEAEDARSALQKKGIAGFIAEVPASWFGKKAQPKAILEKKPKEETPDNTAQQKKKNRTGLFKLATFEESGSALDTLKKVRAKKITSFVLVRRVKEKKFYIVVAYGKESAISKATQELLLSTSLLYGE